MEMFRISPSNGFIDQTLVLMMLLFKSQVERAVREAKSGRTRDFHLLN